MRLKEINSKLKVGRAVAALITALTAVGCGAGVMQQDAAAPLSTREVGQLRYQMVQQLVQQRDYEQALPYLRSLLSAHPDNVPLRLMLAEVLREKGMHQAARRELLAILKRVPDHAGANSAHGVLLDYLGRHAEAEGYHRRAVKAAPKDPRGHNNLGFCLFLRHELKGAQKALGQAISLDPSFRRAFNNLGFVYGLQGNRKAARQAFNQAGSEALALNNLGMVEEMRGQPLQARQLYERALRVHPGYRPAIRNLRALDAQVHADPDPKARSGRERAEEEVQR